MNAMKVNHKLELLDQFDDAAFALMMDEYAEAEGERLRMEFEEATRSGMTPAKPDSLDEKCRKQIRREFGKQRRKEYVVRGKSVAVRAAACILVALCISATLIMSVEAFRVPFWRFLMEEHGVRTDFDFTDYDTNDKGGVLDEPLGMEDPVMMYIPVGYRCVSFEKDHGRIASRYETDDGRYIEFFMHFYQDPNERVMGENEHNKYITILDKKAEYHQSPLEPGQKEISWFDHEIETEYHIVSNEEEEELLSFCGVIVKYFSNLTIDKPTEVPDALESRLPANYEQILSETIQGQLSCSYKDGEKYVDLIIWAHAGEFRTYVQNPVVTEQVFAGYEATVMNGGDEIGTLWYDEERDLVFYFNTLFIPEEEHLALCEYLAEYYKNVTLPAVSTVIWD